MDYTFFSSLAANLVIAIVLIIGYALAHTFLRGEKWLNAITALSVGLIFGLVFFEFFPETLPLVSSEVFGSVLFSGIAAFYVLDLLLHFHHCSCVGHDHAHDHDHTRKGLVFSGMFLHNLFHGIVLWGAFELGGAFGWFLTIGILAHAIPQNIASFLLIGKSWSLGLLMAFAGVIGVLFVIPFEQELALYTPHVLIFNAGTLLYLALSDLLPSLHSKSFGLQRAKYVILVAAGVVLLLAAQQLSGHTHGSHGHGHHDEPKNNAITSTRDTCIAHEGTWVSEHQECLRISPEVCEQELLGEFNECASPCRHDPDATVCVHSCDAVCFTH